MTVERVIPNTENSDLVTQNILVNGEALPATIPVTSIIIQKEVNKIPFARIKINDGDPSLEDFPVSNEDYFLPGSEIEIKIGYRNDNKSLYKGLIITHSNKVSMHGSELVVECKDKAVKLTVGRKNKHFENVADSDIAEEIIDSYGLEKEVESTSTQHEEAVQFNTTDWDFILSRMDRIGRICLVEDGKLIIKKPDLNSDPALDVLFGATILDYHAEIDARNQLAGVSSKMWDYSSQEISEETGDEPSLTDPGNLSPTDLSDIIGLDSYLLTEGGKIDIAELKEWASARMLKSRLSKIKGSVRFQGFSEIKPGDFISLNGVGERFSGPVFVSAIRHEYSGGNWTTEATFGISGQWFSETVNPYNLSAQSGRIPSVQGLQVGKVTDLEDPVGENRVKIRLPIVNPDEEGFWARIATLDAGNERGTFFMPELDDEVIVGFIGNDPDHPVILGMLHSSSLPAPLTASNDNNEKGYVSREKIRMIINDSDKSYTLETPGGKKITLSDNDGIVQVEDENGNKIKMESAGVTVTSATSLTLKAGTDIKLEAVNILLSPSSQFAVSAGGSEIKAGVASAEIKSASVKVEGSGLTEIKGGIVKIN